MSEENQDWKNQGNQLRQLGKQKRTRVQYLAVQKDGLVEVLKQNQWFLAAIICLALLPVGCVRRMLTVRTNPPGALVYVDHQLIGPSPARPRFVYYGTRHIEVVAMDIEPKRYCERFYPKWYQVPPWILFPSHSGHGSFGISASSTSP